MKRLLENLLYKLFGIEYCYTVDFDGMIRKVRMKRLPDGKILIQKIYGWTLANPDGTFASKSYLKQW
jgi:hypothetical protein